MRRPPRWLRLKGELFRETHSRWLTLAVRQPRKYPRIPVVPDAEGGFRDLKRKPGGDVLMEWWWTNTLDQVDGNAGNAAGNKRR